MWQKWKQPHWRQPCFLDSIGGRLEFWFHLPPVGFLGRSLFRMVLWTSERELSTPPNTHTHSDTIKSQYIFRETSTAVINLLIESYQKERNKASLDMAFQWIVASSPDILNYTQSFVAFFVLRDYTWKRESVLRGWWGCQSSIFFLLEIVFGGKWHPSVFMVIYMKECACPRGSN